MFEENLNQMMNKFIESVKRLFVKARSVDTRYFRRLSELSEAIEEKPFSSSSSNGNDIDGLKVSSLVARCHDAHQNLLLEEEEKLQQAISKWKEEFLARFRKRERKRNRNRILELNHFVDSMRQEEEELDILPVTSFNIGEDVQID